MLVLKWKHKKTKVALENISSAQTSSPPRPNTVESSRFWKAAWLSFRVSSSCSRAISTSSTRSRTSSTSVCFWKSPCWAEQRRPLQFNHILLLAQALVDPGEDTGELCTWRSSSMPPGRPAACSGRAHEGAEGFYIPARERHLASPGRPPMSKCSSGDAGQSAIPGRGRSRYATGHNRQRFTLARTL